jgi:hypothetical protein
LKNKILFLSSNSDKNTIKGIKIEEMPNSNEYDFTEESNELRENKVSFQLFIILIIFQIIISIKH